MQISEFDAQKLALRNSERFALEAMKSVKNAFARHLVRTRSQRIALQEARGVAWRRFGLKCRIDERGATFAKPSCAYGIRMTQDDRGRVDFALVELREI